MAKFGSTSALFLVDGFNFLAAKLKTLALKVGTPTEMTDGLGDGYEINTPVGRQQATITQGGGFFDNAAKHIHDAMADQLGSTPNDTPRVMCVGIMGNTLGAVFYGIQGAFSVAYDAMLDLGKLTKANAEHLLAGLVERGQIVQPLATKSADWNTKSLGTVVDYTTDPSQYAIPITSNSQANPSVVTCPVPHGLTTGQVVLISGVADSDADINGEQEVTVIDELTFSVAVDASTAGGTGGQFVLASTLNGGAGYQQVTDFTGLTGFVGKIRHSADDSTYADLVTFANVTASETAERVTCAGTVNRYLCFDGDVTGTGSLGIFAGFCRS